MVLIQSWSYHFPDPVRRAQICGYENQIEKEYQLFVVACFLILDEL